MTALQAIILGIVQGITELLPISSSAHLVLIPELFGWELQPTSFDITVHAATLLALIIYFRKDLLSLITNIKKQTSLILNLIIVTIPAGLIGFFFNDFIEENLKSVEVIVLMLILVGLLMIVIDRIFRGNQKTVEELSKKDALVIGLGQALSFIRGTSRSGITMIAGIFSGLKRRESARFAFLAGIPIMTAVVSMQFLEFKTEGLGDLSVVNLSLAFIFAFLSSLLSIEFLMKFLKKQGLLVFGIYRIILGLAIWIFIL